MPKTAAPEVRLHQQRSSAKASLFERQAVAFANLG